MSLIRRPATFPATVLTLGILSFAIVSERASAQRIAPEFGAAGAPYATPDYCKALPELLTKFEKTILPQQRQDIARQEARLAEAEAGRVEASAEFNNALREGFITLATDQINTGKLMAERVRGMGRSGMTAAAQKEWLAKIKNIEDTGNLLKVGIARADYAELLKQNQDNLVSFMKFVDDSGASNMALKGLADLVAPGIGGVVVGGVKVGLDVIYAGLKGRFTAQDAEKWRDNVEKLKTAHGSLNDRVDGYRDDLTGGLCGPKVAQQVRNSPKPIAPQGAAAPPSVAAAAPPAAAPPPPRSGAGIGKVLAVTAAAGGAVVGGLLAAQALGDLEELGATGGSTTTTSSSQPTSSASANYRYANWNCGSSTQCAAVFGNATGSVGPFCTASACTAYGVRNGGNVTCTTSPQFTLRGFPPAGRACSDQ